VSRAKNARFSAKWDIRTGSPRKLWRALNDLLDDNGFEHEYEQLRLEESAIEGTANFGDTVVGQKEQERRADFWLLKVILGFISCLTIVLIPAGLALLNRTRKTVRTIVRIDIEGEVYRRRGASSSSSHAEEILGVISEARVTLQAWAGEPLKETEYVLKKASRDRKDIAVLESEFDELTYRLGELLPGVTLPVPGQQVDEIP
jgi:hypothetical protein